MACCVCACGATTEEWDSTPGVGCGSLHRRESEVCFTKGCQAMKAARHSSPANGVSIPRSERTSRRSPSKSSELAAEPGFFISDWIAWIARARFTSRVKHGRPVWLLPARTPRNARRAASKRAADALHEFSGGPLGLVLRSFHLSSAKADRAKARHRHLGSEPVLGRTGLHYPWLA